MKEPKIRHNIIISKDHTSDYAKLFEDSLDGDVEIWGFFKNRAEARQGAVFTGLTTLQSTKGL